eukprot:CFRG3407T1
MHVTAATMLRRLGAVCRTAPHHSVQAGCVGSAGNALGPMNRSYSTDWKGPSHSTQKPTVPLERNNTGSSASRALRQGFERPGLSAFGRRTNTPPDSSPISREVSDEEMFVPPKKITHVKLRKPEKKRKSNKIQQGGVVLTRDIVNHGSVLNSFTVEDLVKAKVHIGHHRTLWHPKIQPYLYGVRDDTHIFDLEQTMAHLRRALDVVRRVAHAGGIILFVGNRPQFDTLIRHTAIQCEEYYVTKKYKPGSLTNSMQTLGADVKPDLMIFITLPVSKVALRESYYSIIPSVGITDSDQDPTQVTYSIPGNDDNVEAVTLYCELLKKAVQEGKLYRKHNMELGDFALDVSDDIERVKQQADMKKHAQEKEEDEWSTVDNIEDTVMKSMDQ